MIDLTQEKQRRGYSSIAYKDPDGRWLIGYGSPSWEGQTCTEEEAGTWLEGELEQDPTKMNDIQYEAYLYGPDRAKWTTNEP